MCVYMHICTHTNIYIYTHNIHIYTHTHYIHTDTQTRTMVNILIPSPFNPIIHDKNTEMPKGLRAGTVATLNSKPGLQKGKMAD